MKKIATLVAGCAVGLTAMAAVNPAQFETTKQVIPGDVELSRIRTSMVQNFMDVQNQDADYTRAWTDDKNNKWLLQIELFNEPVGEYFGLVYNDGSRPTLADLPYYPALYMLRKISADGTAVVDGVMFYICWPTEYLYTQIYTYDGELTPDGYIPEEARDYTPVTLDVLANNPNGCRKFIEYPLGYIGGEMNRETGEWENWCMVNNEWFKITSIYNGNQDYTTYVDYESTANGLNIVKTSTIDLADYEKDEDFVEAKNMIYLKQTSGSAKPVINNTYMGTATVEGFEPRYVTTPDFSAIHVFNAGELSSDILGLDNVFTEDFEPVTAFYIVGSDPMYVWGVAPSAKAFNVNDITIALADENAPIEAVHNNVIAGYAFGDAKYAQDITLDPTEIMFNLNVGEFLDDAGYTSIYPKVDSFVTRGYSAEWSKEYGVECDNEGDLLVMKGNSQFGWGTTEGFSLSVLSELNRFVTTVSKQDIIYHYDPTDMQKTRTFSSIGSLKPAAVSAVETVKADMTVAKIAARNGVISVVAGEKAPIAIYTLDGKLVKAAKAETLNVEAQKGMYIVRVGNTAKKVVL